MSARSSTLALHQVTPSRLVTVDLMRDQGERPEKATEYRA
jgi:hypothetical protein